MTSFKKLNIRHEKKQEIMTYMGRGKQSSKLWLSGPRCWVYQTQISENYCKYVQRIKENHVKN